MERAVLTRRRLDDDAEKISKRCPKISKGKIKMVLEAVIEERQNNEKELRPTAPEGSISLRAACRKYGVLNSTLSGWVKRGYIPVLLRTRNWLYIDEAKSAQVIDLYKQDPGQGKKTVKRELSTP